VPGDRTSPPPQEPPKDVTLPEYFALPAAALQVDPDAADFME
jgi:hypothetical protein